MQPRLIEDDRPSLTHQRIRLADLYNDAPDRRADTEMVESLRLHGLLQPLIVMPSPKPAIGYVIVAGRRRLTALQHLWREHALAHADDEPKVRPENPWNEIECYVCGGDSPTLTLVENAQRKANPMVEARAIAALEARGMTESEIAKATGMTVQTIRKRKPLLNLHPNLIDAVDKGLVAVSVGEQACKLTAVQQTELAGALMVRGTVTAHDVREVKQARQMMAMQTLVIPSLFEQPDYTPDWKDEAKMLLRQVETIMPADAPAVPKAMVARLLALMDEGVDDGDA